jgi:hypothetical protein
LKEGTFVPFAKSNFMGHVVYGDDKQITSDYFNCTIHYWHSQ